MFTLKKTQTKKTNITKMHTYLTDLGVNTEIYELISALNLQFKKRKKKEIEPVRNVCIV